VHPVESSDGASSRATLLALGFAESGEGWMLELDAPLTFDTDSDRLGVAQGEAVAKVAKGLLAIGVREVRVEGHTDSTGSRAHNQALSRRRAAWVAEQLVNAGFPPAGVEQRALADTYPLASNATSEGRAKNRRVTITIVPAVAR
jgi:outer membrane protein OmpA-like peptidoglycan-associated protein